MKKPPVLPNQLNKVAVDAVRSKTPRRDYSLRFAHIHAVVGSASPPLNNTAVAMSVDKLIALKLAARDDERRRRGSVR